MTEKTIDQTEAEVNHPVVNRVLSIFKGIIHPNNPQSIINDNTRVVGDGRSGEASAPPPTSLSKSVYVKSKAQKQRMSHVIQKNIENLGSKYGRDYLLFVTLTFGDKEARTDYQEAQRRYNSWLTWFRSKYNWPLIGVPELSEYGNIHYHLVVVAPFNVQEGWNWHYPDGDSKQYRYASPKLKAFWREMRKRCDSHGIGRHEAKPVKKNVQAMAVYLAKYVTKGASPTRRGFSCGCHYRNCCSSRFSWVNSKCSTLYRDLWELLKVVGNLSDTERWNVFHSLKVTTAMACAKYGDYDYFSMLQRAVIDYVKCARPELTGGDKLEPLDLSGFIDMNCAKWRRDVLYA